MMGTSHKFLCIFEKGGLEQEERKLKVDAQQEKQGQVSDSALGKRNP
jgi:hypothetical protein